MRDAGLDRSSVYLTNAVKAFRFEERGKRRIHQTPRPVHIATCRPWLEAEIATVRPERIVCLGATAAQSVLGRDRQDTGGARARHGTAPAREVIVTYHPAAVLRAPDATTQAELAQALVSDLAAAVAS